MIAQWLFAVALSATPPPFYHGTTTTSSFVHPIDRGMHGHPIRAVRGYRNRGYGAYSDGYVVTPDDTAPNDAYADDAPTQPVVEQPMQTAKPEPPRKFPSFNNFTIKGSDDDGCTYKGVMTDDEIAACRQSARRQLSLSR